MHPVLTVPVAMNGPAILSREGDVAAVSRTHSRLLVEPAAQDCGTGRDPGHLQPQAAAEPGPLDLTRCSSQPQDFLPVRQTGACNPTPPPLNEQPFQKPRPRTTVDAAAAADAATAPARASAPARHRAPA